MDVNTPFISFVIPCYNSQDTILYVLDNIDALMEEHPTYGYEVVAVVDGSPDGVAEVLEGRASTHPVLKVIVLSKNYGQSSATMAGYNYASGDYIITLDDDGQCPIDKAWGFIEKMEEGYDLCVAKYPKKKQSWFKNAGSKFNACMARWIVGCPREFEMSNFLAFNKLVLKHVVSYKNPYPYIYGLIFQITNRVINNPMEENDRITGRTNYNLRKLVALWLNGFTSFSVKPLRIADLCGAVCAFTGFLIGAYTIISKLLNPAVLAGYSSIIAAILFIGGLLMVLIGLTGEYIGRIFICINDAPQYVVRKEINHHHSSSRASAFCSNRN